MLKSQSFTATVAEPIADRRSSNFAQRRPVTKVFERRRNKILLQVLGPQKPLYGMKRSHKLEARRRIACILVAAGIYLKMSMSQSVISWTSHDNNENLPHSFILLVGL